METIGDATLVEERHLDAVTAIAGSGPAYVYRYIEAMEKAAQKVGLDKETAKALILQTMAGATDMLLQSGKQPEKLRKEITSPGALQRQAFALYRTPALKKRLFTVLKRLLNEAQKSKNSLPVPP